MTQETLYTSAVAAAVGAHPNTVRLYEEWGLLPPVERSPSGYRLFTPAHVDHMRLAWTLLHTDYVGRDLRRRARELVISAADGHLRKALDLARQYVSAVQEERAQAEAAVQIVERWAARLGAQSIGRRRPAGAERRLRIGEAAQEVNASTDMLRNWERNGLIDVQRNPQNGYRLYTDRDLDRLRVIRVLLRAGYSCMAILRMMLELRRDSPRPLREALDTPHPDDEIVTAADRWLSTLAEHQNQAEAAVDLLGRMVAEAEAGE
jgi:DNA-binding transcriptional MerR regulator